VVRAWGAYKDLQVVDVMELEKAWVDSVAYRRKSLDY
jgi:hypothetical protein